METSDPAGLPIDEATVLARDDGHAIVAWRNVVVLLRLRRGNAVSDRVQAALREVGLAYPKGVGLVIVEAWEAVSSAVRDEATEVGYGVQRSPLLCTAKVLEHDEHARQAIAVVEGEVPHTVPTRSFTSLAEACMWMAPLVSRGLEGGVLPDALTRALERAKELARSV